MGFLKSAKILHVVECLLSLMHKLYGRNDKILHHSGIRSTSFKKPSERPVEVASKRWLDQVKIKTVTPT